MAKTAHFFLGNQYMGSSLVPDTSRAYAFFCHTCGEIWGRIVIEGASWELEHTPCIHHKCLGVIDWGRIPGSFLNHRMEAKHTPIWGQANCLDFLPESVLQYEFTLALKFHTEKEEIA